MIKFNDGTGSPVKAKWEIDKRARRLADESFFINIQDQMMMELPIRKALGEENPLDDYYAPRFRMGGLSAAAITLGGNCPCTCNITDNITAGALALYDMIYQEVEKSKCFVICKSAKDLREAHATGKIGLLFTSEGSRMIEGLPDEDDMSLLRSFYRLGLRQLGVVSPARSRGADGPGDVLAHAGLTTYGRKLIKEMNRLGIVIDTAHMTDPGFYEIAEMSTKPIIDSHTCCKSIVDCGRNVSDERIKAIAATGGVIGVTTLKSFVKGPEYHESGKFVGVDDLCDHFVHVAELVGVEHLAIGTDNDEYPLVRNIHRSWSPFPGSLEGLDMGVPTGNMIIDDLHSYDTFYLLPDALLRRGFTEDEIRMILGGNMLRVYEQVFGE